MVEFPAPIEWLLVEASRKLLGDGLQVWGFCRFAYNHFDQVHGMNFDFHSLTTCSPSKLVSLLTMASCLLYWMLYEYGHIHFWSCR